MEGIVGAVLHLMTQAWAHGPYGGLAGMLMFSNKHDHRRLFALAAICAYS